jgi:hypothetical protein
VREKHFHHEKTTDRRGIKPTDHGTEQVVPQPLVDGDQEAQDLFAELSPRGWQNLFHNAVAVLREVSENELRAHLQDTEFAGRAGAVLANFEKYMADRNTWGRKHAPKLHQNPVAYFSAEFGFHESLPIAAGGLGILAGDHSKSASDLASASSASACSTAKAISSRRLISTTGRRNTTTPLTRTTSRWNPCSMPTATGWSAAWKSA